MTDVLRFSCGNYTIEASLREPPFVDSDWWLGAPLRDEFQLAGPGTLLVVGVSRADDDHPIVIVSQQFDPGPESGFHPGILIIPETDLLLIGAGTRLLAYDLVVAKRLWEDEADTGFWFWRRHSDIVVMSAELELAAWDTRGKKLWTTFVEPPWAYSVEGDELKLDVMGQVSSFPIASGPSSSD